MAQLSTRRPTSIIELHFENQGGQARIVPPDRDIMVMPIELAIEACRAFHQQVKFTDQFKLLVDRLGGWLGEHQDEISSAYLTVRDSGLLFLVVTRERTFNDKLERAVTDLDLEVAHDGDYNLIRFGVHVLPQCDKENIQSFVSRQMVIELKVMGDGERA